MRAQRQALLRDDTQPERRPPFDVGGLLAQLFTPPAEPEAPPTPPGNGWLTSAAGDIPVPDYEPPINPTPETHPVGALLDMLQPGSLLGAAGSRVRAMKEVEERPELAGQEVPGALEDMLALVMATGPGSMGPKAAKGAKAPKPAAQVEAKAARQGMLREGAEAAPASPPVAPEAPAGGMPPIEPPAPPTGGMAAEASPLMPAGGATQRVLSRISTEKTKAPLGERLQQGWENFRLAMLDDLRPVGRFTEEAKKAGAIPIEKDPYIAARLLKGVNAKADTMLEEGTFGAKFWKTEGGKTVPDFKGSGLRQILEPVKDAEGLNDLRAYLVSRRTYNLKGERSIETGVSLDDALGAIAELETKRPRLSQVAEQIYKFQDDVIDYARQKGLLGDDMVNAMRELNKDYVPFYRVIDELEERGGMGKKLVNVGHGIKRIKGSERIIVDPLESIVKNTYSLVSAADRNAVGLQMADLAKANPALQGVFKEIKQPMAPVARVTPKELGIKPPTISEEAAEEVFNIFRPQVLTKDNVVTVLDHGKRRFFEVDPDLKKALLALNEESMGMLGKLLAQPARLLRAGATLSPEFVARNPIRDQWSAFIYSKYGYMPGVDMIRGLANVIGDTTTYKLYQMSGAEHAMLVSMDRDYLQKGLKQITRTSGPVDFIKHPVELLQLASELGEKGTRVGEFSKGLRAGANPLEAGIAARDVTLDFAKAGTSGRALNQIIAFFNANVQGWARLVRAFRENPVGTSAKIGASITLPSVLLYAVNRSDPRWKEIPQWQKDLFWIVMTPDNIYRIPKPFEVGIIFGSMPERFLEWLDTRDPDMMSKWAQSAWGAGLPGLIPTAAEPVIEGVTNFSFFTGRPIVSRSLEGKPEEMQFGPTTSETAKLAGKAIGKSPAKLENLYQGWTGGLGRYATNAIDKALQAAGVSPNIPEPTLTQADIPGLRAFVVRNPMGSASESVDKFYDRLTKLSQLEQGAKDFKKRKDAKGYAAYIKEHPEARLVSDGRGDFYLPQARALRKVATGLSQLREKQQTVYQSQKMAPDQKRKQIDALNKRMTDLAIVALKGGKASSSSAARSMPLYTPPSPSGMGSLYNFNQPSQTGDWLKSFLGQ